MALTAFSLNKITLIGALGKDAETRFTTNNVGVTSFGLATTSQIKKGDAWEKETTWHNIVAFSLSDFIKNALKKGKKFYIEGRISKRTYDDKDGVKRYSVDVIADLIIPFSEMEQSSNQTERQEESKQENEDENEDSSLPF